MNYSSLVPVLQIVLITVLALIEVAPARTGRRPVNEVRPEPAASRPAAISRRSDENPPPGPTAPETEHDLADHGYSSKLRLNSE